MRKRSSHPDTGGTTSPSFCMVTVRCFSDQLSQNEWSRVRDRAIVLIQKPTGELTPEDWFSMQDDMEILIQMDAVELCFRVLNRLAAEQVFISSLTRAAWVDGDLMKRLLKSWMRLFRDQKTDLSNENYKFITELGPVMMMKIVNVYCRTFREMKWSSQTAYYIVAAYNAQMKATAATKPPNRSTTEGPNALDFAREILRMILNEWKQGNDDAKPAPELLQAVANACTSRSIPERQRFQAALQVDDLLLITAQELGGLPDARLYSSSINAWALTRSTEGALKAHERLDQMWEARNDQEEPIPAWIWVNSLRSAIQAWAWSQNHAQNHTLHRVDALLALTHNFIETELIAPTDKMVSVWNAALQAYASVATPEAASQAIELVGVFDKTKESPDRSSYYWYVASLVNGGDIERGEAFLFDLIQARRLTASEDFMSMVLRGWARSSHTDKYRRALEFVEKMGTLSDGRIVPTTPTYNSLLECCSTNVGDDQYFATEGLRILMEMRTLQLSNHQSPVAPDLKSFTSVIKCLARCGDFKRAEVLYEELFTSSKRDRDRNLRPDTVIFNAVLAAFSNSTDESALLGALKFFQKCLTRQRSGELPEGPDSYSFTTLVSCIGRSVGKGPSAEEKAQIASNLLQKLQSLYTEEGKAKWQPTTALYNAVMNCWAKAGSANDCEATIKQMLVDYEEGNEKAVPDIQSFNILLDAFAASNDGSAPARADDLLTKIKELHQSGILHSGPNMVTYNHIIQCHMKNGGKEGAARARALFDEAQEEYEKGNLIGNPEMKINLRDIQYN